MKLMQRKSAVTLVWLLLMGMTLLSWRTGISHGWPSATKVTLGCGILLIAFFKVSLVMFSFMEVARAPFALKIICGLWIVGASVALISIYGIAQG